MARWNGLLNRFGRGLVITTAAGTLFSCASASGPPAGGTYRIATADPEPQVATILHGQLEITANADRTACVWVITWQRRTAVTWPTGFTARGNPVVVYDAAGKPFAKAGESVDLAGGQLYSFVDHLVSGCTGFTQSIKAGPMRNPPEATPGSQTFDQLRISEMAGIVDANRDTFGGLWGDPTTHVVTIYIAAKADKKITDRLTQQVLGVSSPTANTGEQWRVGLLTGGPSLAELDAVINEVWTSSRWSAVNRGNLLSYGIDQKNQVAKFEVDVITPTISAAAVGEFGSMMALEARNFQLPKRPSLARGMAPYRIATGSSPGEAYLAALASGKLAGQVNADGTACFWLGDATNRIAISWPFGYSAAGPPLTIYDADGHKAATISQPVSLGGGNGPEGTPNPLGCSGKFAGVWFAAPDLLAH